MQLGRLPTALRGVLRIAAGSVAGQGLVMLSYPFLTRLYDAAEFGLLTVFTSVVSMVAIVSTATLDRAIPIPASDHEAADVAWTGLSFVAVTTAGTALFGLVAAAPVADLLGVPRLAHYWWLVVLTVLVVGTYFVLSEWMVRDRSYGALGRRNLFQGLGQTVTQIGLGLAQVRPLGLLLGLGVGRLCGLGGLLSSGGLLRQPRPTLARMRRSLRRYRRFPMLTLPSALLNSGGLEIPLLVVSALYGDARAGLLGLTVRVFSAPTALIGQAVDQVFTGESGAAIRDPKGNLARLLRYTVVRLLLVGALPTVLLLVAGPWLFGLVFGPDWTEAGEYARILAFAYLAQFAVNPVSGVLALLERQELSLAWSAARLVLTAGGPAVCGLLGAPVLYAIVALSVGHVVSYVLMYAFSLRAARAADDKYLRSRGRPLTEG
jgi:O-antigen/teichoic acid export membrane protein